MTELELLLKEKEEVMAEIREWNEKLSYINQQIEQEVSH